MRMRGGSMMALLNIDAVVDKKTGKNIFTLLRPHLELIAALVSGLLILIAWALGRWDFAASSVAVYVLAYVIGGYAKAKEGIEETIANKQLNVEMLMIFAAVGSAIIGYWTEGAVLIFIFALSGALETYTMNKSNKEISKLMDLQPEEAGESMPVGKSAGDEVFAGTVNLRGTITVEVTKPNEETLFQKIISLVQSAQSEKSPSQQFIERFEGVYVKTVLAAVAVMMVLPHFLLGWSWNETFYRAMILLVVASPCALVASIMPATLSAISNGAKKGILFKGGVHLENLGNLRAIAFDKTGTLTKGKPEVVNVIVRNGLSEEQFIRSVASIEKYSNHPLAAAIVKFAEDQNIALIKPEKMEDIAGHGVQAYLDGCEWKVGKAAFVEKEEAFVFMDGKALELAEEGKTVVFARDEHGIAGLIALKDSIREEAIIAIKSLNDAGIHTVMLTGDSERTAIAIASDCGIETYVSECLPERKVEEINRLINEYGTVAMVGDGINDAPALATATVGIAMGEGTDVALETADVVLMKNDLPRIAQAVRLSKRMNRIIKQNVVFSILVIMVLISSNFLQFLGLPMGVIGHEGSTILVILNGLRLLKD